MITRTNFLDLLGSNTRKYHSCIITSYTFDILFFEQAVLPRLRRAGIQNINIFVDAHMFQKQLENFQGKEYLNRNRDYSITPVYLNGAFHSKSLLAIGKSKGLLAIGSGNITGSGLSNNEEIWSAFHYKESENLTDGIFTKSIKYLDSLKSHSYAINLRKINWISENSSWYKNFLNNDADFDDLKFNQSQVNIFTTKADSSFFQDVIQHIPRNPLEIKVLSPYYNRSGQFILKLLKYLNPGKIHCVVDPDYGNIPIELNGNSSIEFSEWSKILGNNKLKKSLHAKAYQFEYQDRTIFLLGSANATIEAFGNEDAMAKNAEVLLKIEEQNKRNFFKELGIEFPVDGTLNLSEIKINDPSPENGMEQWNVRILHSEFHDFILQLFVDNILTGKLILRIENADSKVLSDKLVGLSDFEIEINIDDIVQEDIFRCSLWKDGHRISPYAYPQNSSALLGTNPDERLARWGEIRSHDIFEGLGIEVFLDFLKGNQFFENRSSGFQKIKETERVEDTPNPVTTEEFNKNASVEDNTRSRQSHLTSLIEDFLSQLVFGGKDEVEVSDNVEQEAMGNFEEPANEKEVVHKETNFSYSEGLRIRRKLDHVLNKIMNYLGSASANLYSGQSATTDDYQLSMEHLNAQLIGLSLILKYLNKPFDQKSIDITIGFKKNKINELYSLEKKFNLERHAKQNGNPDGVVSYDIDINYIERILDDIQNNNNFNLVEIDKENIKKVEHFILSPYWHIDISGEFIIYGLGQFLFGLLKKIVSVDEKRLLKKDQQITKILEFSILIIYNFKWSKKDLIYRDLMLLNILNSFTKPSSTTQIINRLTAIIESEQNSLEFADDNMDHLSKIRTKYENFIRKVKSNSSSIRKTLDPVYEKQIIYSTGYGFAILNNVRSNKFVDLETPLGIYHENKQLYGFSNVFIGKQIKIFNY
jgi:HKD family nuclease